MNAKYYFVLNWGSVWHFELFRQQVVGESFMASIEPAPPPSENRKERCNGKQDKTEKEADTHEKLSAYARKC